VYAIFRRKNKSDRAADPAPPPHQQQGIPQYPREESRRKGIFADLEDLFRDAEERQDSERAAGVDRYSAERYGAERHDSDRLASQGRSISQGSVSTQGSPPTQASSGKRQKTVENRGGSPDQSSPTGLESQTMHKNAAIWKGITMERASIVDGFIWSQILGDPVCKRPPRSHRR